MARGRSISDKEGSSGMLTLSPFNNFNYDMVPLFAFARDGIGDKGTSPSLTRALRCDTHVTPSPNADAANCQ